MKEILRQCEIVCGKVHSVRWIKASDAREGAMITQGDGWWCVLKAYKTRREVSDSSDGFDRYF